jgi:hypothetical protein
MADFPNYVEAVVQSLSKLGLLISSEARQEIDQFFNVHAQELLGRWGQELGGFTLEQSRALSLLNAAEYALLPAFANPGESELPPAQAITVSVSDARLALLKGDCSLIIWTHVPSRGIIESLRVSDLMVFGGDASKVRLLLDTGGEDAPIDTSNVRYFSNQLESEHLHTDWEPAARVVHSGAIRLQSLLWLLKLAVVENPADDKFRRALRDLGFGGP